MTKNPREMTMVAVAVIPAFVSKVEDCLSLIAKMSPGDKVAAVDIWNSASEILQRIVDARYTHSFCAKK